MNYTDIEKLIPTSWDQIKLKDFVKIADAKVDVADEDDDDLHNAQRVDNIFNILSTYLNIPLADLYSIEFTDIPKVVNAMSFIYTDVVPKDKPLPNQKKDLDITYGNYITYTNLSQDVTTIHKHLGTIVKSFLTDDSDVNEMNMVDVITVFFFANKLLVKSMKTTRRSLLVKLVKQLSKAMITRFKGMFRKRSTR
jgi:hypothetical protein